LSQAAFMFSYGAKSLLSRKVPVSKCPDNSVSSILFVKYFSPPCAGFFCPFRVEQHAVVFRLINAWTTGHHCSSTKDTRNCPLWLSGTDQPCATGPSAATRSATVRAARIRASTSASSTSRSPSYSARLRLLCA